MESLCTMITGLCNISIFYFNRVAHMIVTFDVLIIISLPYHELCFVFSYMRL